jgi:ABC-2 type transport system ATP-binding protein
LPLAIETCELTKQFPKSKGIRDIIPGSHPARLVTAVDRVNLTVEQGELFGLLGPNGAGKTTLIKLLCTLIVPTGGTARVDGYDLRQEAAIKASVGLVTGDERSFYWRLSGRQNLEFFAALHGFSPDPARRRVQEVLNLVELAEVADEQFQTYSTGMRQRLSIARGLLHAPRLLFLDEPTKSLDPMATHHMHDLIRHRLVGQEGVTVFLATHRLEEAGQLCHRVAIMDQGRLRACGTIPELRAKLHPGEHYRLKVRGFQPAMRDEIAKLVTNLQVTFLDDQDALLEFTALNGEEILSPMIDVIRSSGGEIKALRSETVPLEDVFAHLTGEPAGAAKSLLVTR